MIQTIGSALIITLMVITLGTLALAPFFLSADITRRQEDEGHWNEDVPE